LPGAETHNLLFDLPGAQKIVGLSTRQIKQ
jgi:hypothetical protein